MKKYDSYKPSGISWIGAIPSHWEVTRLRNLLSLVSEKGHGDKQLLSITREQGVIIRNVESKESNHNFIPEDLNGYKLVKVGQFAINKMKAWQGSYAVSSYEGIVSPAYYICDLNFENKDFFSWAIRSKAYVPFFTQMSKGIRVDQWDLSTDALKEIPFFVPDIIEQNKIVEFLTEKTRLIDEQQKNLDKEIQYLQELKQAEITNVVTRGLNPDIPMKDSGIPWIGQIPEHWSVKYLFQFAKEHFISNKEIHHQNLLSLSYGNIIRKDINKTDGLLPESFDTYQVVETGNIILRLTDLQNDHKSLRVGLVTEEGIITSAYVCLEIDSAFLPEYFYYFLHMLDLKKIFYSMGGGLRQNLNFNGLRKLEILLPSKEEQKKIVEYIKNRSQAIDDMISNLKSQKDFLTEYKQRLISDAVTGQIDVRDYKSPTSAQ